MIGLSRNIFFLLLFCNFCSLYAGTQFLNHSALQLGRGQTGIAAPDGVSALSFNPALTAFVPSSISASVGMGNYRLHFREAGIPGNYLSQTNRFPFGFFGNWNSDKHDFALSFGAYQQFQHSSNWDPAWKGRFVSIKSNLSDYVLQPGFSYQFQDRFSIGIGLQIHRIQRLFSRSFTTAVPAGQEGILELDQAFWSFSAQLGIFGRIGKSLNLGLTFQAPVSFANTASRVRVFPDASLPQFTNEIADYKQQLPWRIGFGAVIQSTDAARFFVDINYSHFSQMDSMRILPASPNTFDPVDESLYRRSSFSLHAGSEFDLSRLIVYRLGMVYTSGKAKPGTLRTDYSFNKLISLTTGAGIFFSDWVEADIALAYTRFIQVNESADLNHLGIGGQFDGNSFWVSFGLRFNFKNQRLLRERIRNF